VAATLTSSVSLFGCTPMAKCVLRFNTWIEDSSSLLIAQ